jgi:hypothetical protein
VHFLWCRQSRDDNSLADSIPEGEFATSTVSILIGASHPRLGDPLGVRVVNLNVTPADAEPGMPPDLEVDFDDVRLDAQPAGVMLFADGFESPLID